MKSYVVTIQMKPLQQYFHMVLFIQFEILTFESVHEILFPHERALSVFKALNKLDKITMISALALSCRLFEIYGFVGEKNWLGLKSNWEDLSMLRFSCIVPDPIYGHLKVSAGTSFIFPYVFSPTPLNLAACWHVLSSRLARPLKWRACLPANFWTLKGKA